jgi:predicted transcriptional regulator
MQLEVIMWSEISLRKTNITFSLLCETLKKIKNRCMKVDREQLEMKKGMG